MSYKVTKILSENLKVTKTVEVRGLHYPKSILKLGKVVRKREEGTIIEVIVTDPDPIPYVSAYVKRADAEIPKVNEGKDGVIFLIRS